MCTSSCVGRLPCPRRLWLTRECLADYYYYATAGGAKIWWKKYLTSLQITQFVIDLFVVYFACECRSILLHRRKLMRQFPAYTHFAMVRFKKLPTMGDCAGSEDAAIFGVSLLTSYLFLFIACVLVRRHKRVKLTEPICSFYRATYKKPAGKGAVKGRSNGEIRGSEKSKVRLWSLPVITRADIPLALQ